LEGIPVNGEIILQYIFTYLGCGLDSMWSGWGVGICENSKEPFCYIKLGIFLTS
jgi:hypothetical protein